MTLGVREVIVFLFVSSFWASTAYAVPMAECHRSMDPIEVPLHIDLGLAWHTPLLPTIVGESGTERILARLPRNSNQNMSSSVYGQQGFSHLSASTEIATISDNHVVLLPWSVPHITDLIVKGEYELLRYAEEAADRHLIRNPHAVHKMLRPTQLFQHKGRTGYYVEVPDASFRTLTEVIRKQENFRPNWFLTVARTIITQVLANGLEYHGNVSPNNIFVSKDRRKARLGPPSFRFIKGVTEPHPAVPYSNLYTITPQYTPFFYRDLRDDVVAMGIILYLIQTGYHPWKDDPVALAEDHVPIRDGFVPYWLYAEAQDGNPEGQPRFQRMLEVARPVTELNPSADPELARITMNCLLHHNSYSMEQLQNDLTLFLRASKP